MGRHVHPYDARHHPRATLQSAPQLGEETDAVPAKTRLHARRCLEAHGHPLGSWQPARPWTKLGS